MHVVITGGTGFIGSRLAASLLADGHSVVILTRQSPEQAKARHPNLSGVTWLSWPGDARPNRHTDHPDHLRAPWTNALDGADAVVHLAGSSIAAGRWNQKQKAAIRQSRIESTRRLVRALQHLSRPPRLLICASAVGYYGSRGDDVLTEQSEPGNDFLASVCREWEAEAEAAASLGTRVVRLRTGLVLDAKAGALPRMLLPYRLLVGGPLGDGRQWMAWIHIRDHVRLIRFLLEHPAASGPVNGTAPEPVTNRQFSRILARKLRRPSWVAAPAPFLRLALGEMADALLLSSQRAIPQQAVNWGFSFQFPRLDEALTDLFRR